MILHVSVAFCYFRGCLPEYKHMQILHLRIKFNKTKKKLYL